MKEYYYLIGQTKMGPYTLDELLKQPLTRDSKVWYDGLPDWMDAVDMPEFAGHFTNHPPPAVGTPPAPPVAPSGAHTATSARGLSDPMPKNWLIESILVTIFCCLPFGIAGIVFASRVESSYRAGDMTGAEHNAREAAKWTKIGFFIGIAGIVIWIGFMIVAAVAGLGAASQEFDY